MNNNNDNNNPSVVPENAYENAAMVAALSQVLRGTNNEGGPSGVVLIESPAELEICRGCGMTQDRCLGCDLFPDRKRKKYRGVNLRAAGNWGAEIMVPGKKREWLGTYKTAEEAARAYDMANIRCRGKTAKTNFPVEEYPEIQPEEEDDDAGQGS